MIKNGKSVVKQNGSTALAKLWEKPAEIKKLFAPLLTMEEFNYFMGLSKQFGANPFLKEIWAVKYDKNKPASVFLGRDYYRGVAQRQPNYDGHMSDAIYSEDHFEVVNGETKHKYSQNNRGNLVGAYAIVRVKGRSLHTFKRVLFSEYNKKQSTWNSIPETMICKVAEAQALRMTWQKEYSGAYCEDEQFVIDASYEEIRSEPPAPEPKPKGESGPNYEELEILMLDKFCDIDKVRSYLKAKSIDNISSMNAMQYEAIYAEVLAM